MTSIAKRSQTEKVALVAYDLWKSFGNRPVVQGVDFSLNPGEILGLLGPNGAGKSTIVGMLYGIVKPDRGFVQLGENHIESQGSAARAKMGIVTQEDNLDPDFTVWENLTYFAHHYRITGKAARQRAGELLALVGLEDRGNALIDELSGGMKRRLVLARALINHPQVVFLDEPTTGLDPNARQDFWRSILQLKQEGCGVLLTTHYMDEAQRLCDRLLLLQQGKILDRGTPTELIERTVGLEVAEIAGVTESTIQQLARQAGTWYHPFGASYLLGLPENPQFWQEIQTIAPTPPIRRATNLEDVFLQLTGTALDE
jgi:lipooligosaccharide transport system ATP-binding protein